MLNSFLVHQTIGRHPSVIELADALTPRYQRLIEKKSWPRKILLLCDSVSRDSPEYAAFTVPRRGESQTVTLPKIVVHEQQMIPLQ